MPEEKASARQVWSCRLCPSEQEDEAERLENALLGRELELWEDAEALRRFLALSHLSQAACARRLGRSQASVANRLRILRLPEDVREILRRGNMTERHARALLRLPEDESRRRAAAVMLKNAFSVAEAEDYVEAMLSPRGAAASLRREQREAVGELWTWLSRLQGRCPGLAMELREERRDVVITLRLPK